MSKPRDHTSQAGVTTPSKTSGGRSGRRAKAAKVSTVSPAVFIRGDEAQLAKFA